MTAGVILAVMTAFALAIFTTGLMRRYALRKNLIDVPNVRSSHISPTPRGGGVAIVTAFFASILLLASAGLIDTAMLRALLIGGGAMALVGFLDDCWHLRASVRFGVHLAAALAVVIMLRGVPESALAGWGLHGVWIGSLMAVLVLVWVTNLFNFMDGIDGIAGSEAVFVSGAGALVELVSRRITRPDGRHALSRCGESGVPALELAAGTNFHGRCRQRVSRIHVDSPRP